MTAGASDGTTAMLAADASDGAPVQADGIDGGTSENNLDASAYYGDITQSTGRGSTKETSDEINDDTRREQREETGKQNAGDDTAEDVSEGVSEDVDREEDAASEPVPQVSSVEYCFVIPEGSYGQIADIIGRYASASVCAGEYLDGTYKDGASADENGSADREEISLGAGLMNTARYLVVKDDVLYFTDSESMVPEEDSMVYLIADPDTGRESLVSEIEELLR